MSRLYDGDGEKEIKAKMFVTLRNLQSTNFFSESLLGTLWDESPSAYEGSDWWKQQKIGSKPTEGSLITAEDKRDRNRESEQLIPRERTVLYFGWSGRVQTKELTLEDPWKVCFRRWAHMVRVRMCARCCYQGQAHIQTTLAKCSSLCGRGRVLNVFIGCGVLFILICPESMMLSAYTGCFINVD